MDAVYFVGHSLGLQPKFTQKLVTDELTKWQQKGVNGHFEGQYQWLDVDEHCDRGMARIVGAQVKEAVEKVKTKEKYINAQFEGLKKEYADQREALKAVEAKHGTIESTVGDLTAMADSISEQLDEVKSTMSDRSNSMTDSQPLKHIKDALNRIKKEISTFELRIGVVNHTLMQAKLKTGKRQSRHKSDGGKSVDTGDDDGEFDEDGGF